MNTFFSGQYYLVVNVDAVMIYLQLHTQEAQLNELPEPINIYLDAIPPSDDDESFSINHYSGEVILLLVS